MPITDRREFLKTNYNATLRTRRIMDLSQRIRTIIRDVGGHVDVSTAAERWGYVAFAVPADRFESFRRETKSLAPERFIVEETRKVLGDTVATIEGHISLTWIGIWEVIHLYFPLYWLAALFSLGATASFILHRERSRLIIV